MARRGLLFSVWKNEVLGFFGRWFAMGEECPMGEFEDIDFFRGNELIADPYPYFDHLREQCPVQREPNHGVVMVTGYDEAVSVYTDTATFSSCNSVTGPFPGFPVPLEGDDVSDLIEQYRDELPFSDQITTFDPPKHRAHRGLLMRLLTPKRLRENEAFMHRLADRQIDEFVDRGECEFITDYAGPFTLYVIADLLGIPESQHETFREELQGGHRRDQGLGSTGSATLGHSPLEFLYDRLSAFIEDRRREPRNDVLTGLATATFPDGSTPEVIDVVRVAANVFSAGQETTVRLLGTALLTLGERRDIQDLLREDPEKIPNFVEECLRIESPVKGDFRLSRTAATVGGVDVSAGTTLMVLNGAAGRDPRHFDNPGEFQIDRPNAREHLAFGRGPHACPGGSLARAEACISIEHLLQRLSDIKISESSHGPAGARRYDYVPTYILRGLQRLHLDFTPAAPHKVSE
jgi:cytochrome P450